MLDCSSFKGAVQKMWVTKLILWDFFVFLQNHLTLGSYAVVHAAGA